MVVQNPWLWVLEQMGGLGCNVLPSNLLMARLIPANIEFHNGEGDLLLAN